MNTYKPKSDLQEIFQKRKLEFPKYHTYKDGTRYCCIITLYDGREIIGEYCKGFKEAENYTASKAIDICNTCCIIQSIPINTKKSKINNLEYLTPNNANPVLDPIFTKTALIIRQGSIKKIGQWDKLHKYTIFLFVNEGNNLSYEEYPPNVNTIFCKSERPDILDTCISTYLGTLLSQEKFDQYLIMTTHHTGNNMVEMIQSNHFGWRSKKAFVITETSQLL